MPKRIVWTLLLLALFLLAGGLSFAVDLYFDLLWLQELGKTTIFTTILYAKSMLGAGTMLVAFLFMYLNLLYAERGPGLIQIGIPTPQGQITAYTFPAQTLRKLLGLLALVVAIFFALRNADSWEAVWQWLHKVDFGQADPVFGRDISFYFFTLPVLEEGIRFGLLLCMLTGAAVLLLYHFKGILTFRRTRGAAGRGRVPSHISVLAAFLFLLL